MRYLKKYESVNLENDLRDFCEMNLAYLLDGDFELSVIWQGHGHMGRAKDCYNINLCKLDDNSRAVGFTWNEVKDSYIPFLYMLDKQYEIMDEGEEIGNAGQYDVPCICLYNGSQNFCVSIKDVLSGEPLPSRYDDVDLLQITLRVEMKKITEAAVNFMRKDDIEHYLAYLIDEGFEVKSITEGGDFADVKHQQSINMMRKLSREEFSDLLASGINHKMVIFGIGNNPVKVFDTPVNGIRKEKLLSSYNCGLLTDIDERAHEAADRLLNEFKGFSTSKIIISFKIGEGTVQQFNFGDVSIRLQIILIE